MADEADGPRRGRKYDQVLAGAREIFLRDGFEGASVDDVARAAQVSKATLYSYFPDKRLLFAEVAQHECRRATAAAMMLVDLNDPPEKVLPEAARQLIDFLLSDFGRAMCRISLAEADRFPDLAQAFYDCGPALVRDRLGAYLAGSVARGELAIPAADIPFAAEQFAELCKAQILMPALLGVVPPADRATRERVGQAAVDMFLARYRAR